MLFVSHLEGFHYSLWMSHHYVVSAQQSTTVTHCLKGHFLSDESLDIVLAKSSKLEIYSVTETGFSPIFEVPIFGRVSSLCKYYNKGFGAPRSLIS